MSDKSFEMDGKIYRVYESSPDFYHIREVETAKTPLGVVICTLISFGGIYYAAKILKLI